MAAVAQTDRYESYLARYGTRWPQSRPRGVALCVEPSLGERRTLPAARGSSQLAASAESLVTDAERSKRRVTCLLHIISDVTRVRHAQGTTLSILRAFIARAAAVQTAVLVLFGPSCLGHYRPLQRRSASDKSSARCRPIKQRDKFYRIFFIKTTFDEVHFCHFKKIYCKYCTRDIFWRSLFLETYFRKHTIVE